MAEFRRAVVLAVGSGGDVFPFVEVAASLARRGLEVTVLGPQRFQPHAAQRGIEYHSIGAEEVYREVFDGDDVWDARKGTAAAWRYYVAAARSGHKRLSAEWGGTQTLLVSSSFAIAARLAQEREGFSNVTVHLSPSVLFSAIDPPRWPGPSVPKTWPVGLKRLLVGAAERLALEPVIGPPVNALRAELGLAPVKRVFSRWIHSPQRVVYAFPEWFAAAAPDWPPAGSHATFPCLQQRVEALPAALLEFLDGGSGSRTILVTAGTAVRTRQAWVQHCIGGALDAGLRVIAVAPQVGAIPPRADLLWLDRVPFDQVFPHLALVVHHGGIGTMAEALRAGVRQLAVPTAHDQFDNADRMQTAGLGLVGSAQWSRTQFADALRQAIDTAGLSAPIHRAQQRIAQGPQGADRIADLVLGR